MAGVLLTTTARVTKWSPFIRANFERVVRASENDRVGKHFRVENPNEADVILFVESNSPFQFDILRCDLYRRFPEKCFVFDSQDYALPLVPGLYMCVPEHLNESSIYQYGFYIRVFDNLMLNGQVQTDDPEFLFSFIGRVANCERVRRPILELNHPRAFLADRSSGQAENDQDYVTKMYQSKFVLCPRGFGPSTWRCFEAMSARRVPVIISDSWTPPPGLNWNEFSIQVPEAEIEAIPSILEKLEGDAEEMGSRARTAWECNFSLQTSFNWLIDRCLEIQHHIPKNEKVTNRNRLKEVDRDFVGRFVKDYIRLRPVNLDLSP